MVDGQKVKVGHGTRSPKTVSGLPRLTMSAVDDGLDEAVFEQFVYWTNGKSLLSARDMTGQGPLLAVLRKLKDLMCLMVDAHRESLNLPPAKPMWCMVGAVITSTTASFKVRWRGYRCEEDDPDEERPAKDMAPFMSLSATLQDDQVIIKLQGLPRGKAYQHSLPVLIARAVYTPLLRDLIATGLEIVDTECATNPKIALRPQLKLRSGKTIDKYCPCGPNAGHLFL